MYEACAGVTKAVTAPKGSVSKKQLGAMIALDSVYVTVDEEAVQVMVE